jgi:hypothetical protein
MPESPVFPPAVETKPFWRTSEFWLVALTNLAVIATALADVLPPKYAAPVMAGVNGLYAVARGLAKQGQASSLPAPTVVVQTVPPQERSEAVPPRKTP